VLSGVEGAAIQNPKFYSFTVQERVERSAGLSADPDLASLVNFFLPDRHGFFDFLDGETARGKRASR